MEKRFKLPTLGAIWNRYYTYNISRIKELWYDKMAVYMMFSNEIDPCPESIISWHYIMVLTELLKIRGGWDGTNHCPKE